LRTDLAPFGKYLHVAGALTGTDFLSLTDALGAADALLEGGSSPARTVAHVAALHAFSIHGDAPAQAAVRGALAADLAPLTVLLSALVCGKKVRGWSVSSSWVQTCDLEQASFLKCRACLTRVLLSLPSHHSANQPNGLAVPMRYSY
jgi:hypothetical protein